MSNSQQTIRRFIIVLKSGIAAFQRLLVLVLHVQLLSGFQLCLQRRHAEGCVADEAVLAFAQASVLLSASCLAPVNCRSTHALML